MEEEGALMSYVIIFFTRTFNLNIADCLDLLNLEERVGEIYVGISLAVNVCEGIITSRY